MSTYVSCLVSSTVKMRVLEMGQVCPSDTPELKFSPHCEAETVERSD